MMGFRWQEVVSKLKDWDFGVKVYKNKKSFTICIPFGSLVKEDVKELTKMFEDGWKSELDVLNKNK